ncbi:MAG: hypothetical protein WCE48_06420 [Steroidobacteraceae bacterium]
MKNLVATTLVIGALLAGGCANNSGQGSPSDIGPTNTAAGNSNPGGATTPPVAASNVALFQLSAGILPYPTDLYFSGTTDGTLNIQPANALNPNQAAINALDGFSTTAAIRARFGGALNAASLTAASVRVIQVNIDNATKATIGVVRPLVLGTDFSVGLATDAGVGNQIVEIKPLKPLAASTGATNRGYLVLLTNSITDASGAAAVPDTDYATIKAALPTCASITNATLNGVCRLTGAQLQIAQAIGVNPASVVLSFSFSTGSVDDSFAALAATVPAQAIAVAPTGLTTKQANPALQGKANIYVGTTTVPYYLKVAASPQDTGVLTTPWTAAGPSPVPGIDPASRFITRFNPLPKKTADLQIPLLVTVPNATAAGGAGCPKPAAGWPVAIVQHGLGGNRTQALAMADSFADACFIVAAIDLPLHGVTDVTNPFYQATRERTFNLDVLTNATGAPGTDGKIDSSGANIIQLPSPLTSRDNLRQGEADTIVFSKSLVNLDVTGDGVPDIDPARIHYVGLSLGGIVGGVHAQFAATTRTATLAVPGGVITQLLLDSPTFGASIRAGLAAQGVTEGTTLFSNFFRDVQNAIDAGDPINHIADAVRLRPIHLIQVTGDTVIPNSATQRLVTAGGLQRLSTAGATPVSPGNGKWVNFIAGSHGSLFDPTASLPATVEMQSQTVQFAASAVAPGGPFVVITNTAVIQP